MLRQYELFCVILKQFDAKSGVAQFFSQKNGESGLNAPRDTRPHGKGPIAPHLASCRLILHHPASRYIYISNYLHMLHASPRIKARQPASPCIKARWSAAIQTASLSQEEGARTDGSEGPPTVVEEAEARDPSVVRQSWRRKSQSGRNDHQQGRLRGRAHTEISGNDPPRAVACWRAKENTSSMPRIADCCAPG